MASRAFWRIRFHSSCRGLTFELRVNLDLLADEFVHAHQTIVTRVRFQDMSPAEAFTVAAGGTLETAQFTPEGQAFAESYYPRYLDDFVATFGGDIYDVDDDWAQYSKIAPVLTAALMAFRAPAQGRRGASGRRWWRFWE